MIMRVAHRSWHERECRPCNGRGCSLLWHGAARRRGSAPLPRRSRGPDGRGAHEGGGVSPTAPCGFAPRVVAVGGHLRLRVALTSALSHRDRGSSSWPTAAKARPRGFGPVMTGEATGGGG